MTTADYVDSLVSDIESAGVEDIVIVGHSMGGMTLPGVVTKLGAARVREMIFTAAFLPPEGTSIVESSPWVIRTIARRRAKKNVPTPTPKWYARFVFLNGVPSHGRRFMAGKLYAESLLMLIERVSRRGMPDDIPRTWILTRRDRALAPKVQRKYIEALGGVQKVIEIDTCHCLMISEPERALRPDERPRSLPQPVSCLWATHPLQAVAHTLRVQSVSDEGSAGSGQ